MGAWGSGLYANDTTGDVRDTYIGFLKEQLSNCEAYEKTRETFREYLEDPDEAPFFWFALSDTQWRVGRLIPEVKSEALEWINKEGGIELWADNKNGGIGWKKTLEKLRNQLDTAQPREKKLRKSVKINQNLWNIGDVYAYQFHTNESAKYGAFGKYMIMQKIDEEPYFSEELIMRVHIFDKLFDTVPTSEDLLGIRLLPLDSPTSTRNLRMSSRLALEKKKEYPEEYLTFIGNMPIPANAVRKQDLHSQAYWGRIESWSVYFQRWQSVEYETVEHGVFRYTHFE